MVHDALDIARYIIWHEAVRKRPASNLKLQKLLYFVQMNYLDKWEVPCFKDKTVAWDAGAFVPKVHQEFKYYGCNIIPYDDIVKNIHQIEIPLVERKFIDLVLDELAKGKFKNEDLLDIIHKHDCWREAYQKSKYGGSGEITTEAMLKYVRELKGHGSHGPL